MSRFIYDFTELHVLNIDSYNTYEHTVQRKIVLPTKTLLHRQEDERIIMNPSVQLKYSLRVLAGGHESGPLLYKCTRYLITRCFADVNIATRFFIHEHVLIGHVTCFSYRHDMRIPSASLHNSKAYFTEQFTPNYF